MGCDQGGGARISRKFIAQGELRRKKRKKGKLKPYEGGGELMGNSANFGFNGGRATKEIDIRGNRSV